MKGVLGEVDQRQLLHFSKLKFKRSSTSSSQPASTYVLLENEDEID